MMQIGDRVRFVLGYPTGIIVGKEGGGYYLDGVYYSVRWDNVSYPRGLRGSYGYREGIDIVYEDEFAAWVREVREKHAKDNADTV